MQGLGQLAFHFRDLLLKSGYDGFLKPLEPHKTLSSIFERAAADRIFYFCTIMIAIALRVLSITLAACFLPAFFSRAGNYTNFGVAIYLPVGVVRSFENPQKLQDDWNRISTQLKVDKVYIEVQRNRGLAGDDLLE